MSNRKFKVKVPLDTADIRKRITDISTVEIELTEDQVIELSKQLNTPETNGRYYFPKEGETYWYLDEQNNVTWEHYESNGVDGHKVLMGVFKEKEDAEKARDRQLALVQIDKWIQENEIDTNVDWNDTSSCKHYPRYDIADEWTIDRTYYYNYFSVLQTFKSKEDCLKFISECKPLLDKLL